MEEKNMQEQQNNNIQVEQQNNNIQIEQINNNTQIEQINNNTQIEQINNSSQLNNENKTKNTKKILIIIGIIVLLVGITIGYFVIKQKNENKEENLIQNKENINQNESNENENESNENDNESNENDNEEYDIYDECRTRGACKMGRTTGEVATVKGTLGYDLTNKDIIAEYSFTGKTTSAGYDYEFTTTITLFNHNIFEISTISTCDSYDYGTYEIKDNKIIFNVTASHNCELCLYNNHNRSYIYDYNENTIIDSENNKYTKLELNKSDDYELFSKFNDPGLCIAEYDENF